jgi:hypothetical protein
VWTISCGAPSGSFRTSADDHTTIIIQRRVSPGASTTSPPRHFGADARTRTGTVFRPTRSERVKATNYITSANLVRRTGLEPARPFEHGPLMPASLPFHHRRLDVLCWKPWIRTKINRVRTGSSTVKVASTKVHQEISCGSRARTYNPLSQSQVRYQLCHPAANPPYSFHSSCFQKRQRPPGFLREPFMQT